MISIPDTEDVTNFVVAVTTKYGLTQRDGFGYGYHSPDSKYPIVKKSKRDALSYWVTHDDKIVSDAVIYHTRIATQGGIEDSTSHPFKSQGIAVTHNGMLYHYDSLKEELTKLGVKFKTEVDSELILHSFNAYGWKFLEEFEKHGVGGTMAIQILHPDGTIQLYRTVTADYKIYEAKEGGVVGMSDGSVFSGLTEIESGTIYTIDKGKVVSKEKKPISLSVTPSTYNVPATYNYKGSCDM
jgi:glutamine phosphoribosylpyrophosphate amidotransferase